MSTIIPNELKTVFNDSKFLELLYQEMEAYKFSERPFFQMYNEEELENLIKAFIIYKYNAIENESFRSNYPESLSNEFVIRDLCAEFIHICNEAFKENTDVQAEALRDFNALCELRNYHTRDEFKNLDSLNLPICEVIESGFWLDDFDYTKLNVKEIILLTKCEILKECSTLEELYDRISSIIGEQNRVAGCILKATKTYIDGNATEEDRKAKREEYYNTFVSINIISMGLGFTRKTDVE